MVLDTTVGYDGKTVITVNGKSPGPELRLRVGERANVRVYNRMKTPTVVHWHGMSQRGTPESDGVPGVTQLPIDPGDSYLYSFTPETAGTFWYHSHWDVQRVDGLYGPLIITGGSERVGFSGPPAGDPLMWMISDWYDLGADSMLEWFKSPASQGEEPTPDRVDVNGEFSGRVFSGCPRRTSIRLINVAAINAYNVSFGVPMTVREIDGFAVAPMVLPWVVLDIAQRVVVDVDVATNVSVTVKAMSKRGDRVLSTSAKLRGDMVFFDALWQATLVPSGDASAQVPAAIVSEDLTPIPNATFELKLFLDKGLMNGSIYTPIDDGIALGTYARAMDSVVPQNAVVDLNFTNLQEGVAHPIHLHGHWFWIVAMSSDGEDATTAVGVRRDVISVPGSSWVVVRFVADNPGVWMLHCHIMWHARMARLLYETGTW